MKCFLGIDNGGTATKAAVFDSAGREMAVASAPTPVIQPKDGFMERDMDALWTLTAQVIHKAVSQAGIKPEDIAGIGCTGHGKGLYLWGGDDRPVGYAIASTDNRAAEIVSEWEKHEILDRAALLTCQRIRACQPAALLSWIKQNRPEEYSRVKWVFEAKDYIRFMLTGEAFAELTDCSGTGLLNLHTKDYDPALLELFGIQEMQNKLPPLRKSHDLCGHVTARAAQECGLKEGTPVCGGMFDIDACAVAMDVSDESRLCAITGTWSINEYLSKAPVELSKTTLNSLFCMPEFYLIEESSPTSAGNLEWVVDVFFGEQTRLWKKQGLSAYQEADRLVDESLPADSDIVFLPFLYGSNAPGIEKAVFFGMNAATTTGQLLRSVFEGVVFSHKRHIDRLLEYKNDFQAVRLAGGAAKSGVWVQMFADILQLPVEVVTVKELGTLGACMAAAVAAGECKDYTEAAKAMSGEVKTVYPDKSLAPVYEEKYKKYCWLIQKLSAC